MNPAATSAAAPVKVDPTKTRMAQELKHSSPLIGCRIDPSGRFVFASAQDSTLQRWELASGTKTAFTGHKGWVRALAFAARSKLLFSGGYDGRILAWPVDAGAPKPLRTIDAHKGWVRALAVSPDGQSLASCGNDGLVKLWSVADGKLLGELRGHDTHVYNVAFHPSGRVLASADLKGGVKEWDVLKGAFVRDLDARVLHKYDTTFHADIGGARAMAFSPDGSLLACAGITNVSNAFAGVGNPIVVLFDTKSGQRKNLLKPKTAFQGTAWGVVFHPDGFVAAAGGGNGGALWFWKPEQAEAFHTVSLPNNARDLDLHPDGKRLAIPCYDGSVRIYDLTPPVK
jgi:WD40 repeat protein